ncbi:hypothetical protein [Altererythrobacter sp. C41]|uniref:hypothetical protein n=1 Tax=Altererythrobacter sp. C41 TaxID=2806021 RepID=UPI0019335351|nr:hypothetical protein [Altererythrobacter sp. C41]MBM0169662.1 hypothetical protein [Altererythrobacter sp. C41]
MEWGQWLAIYGAALSTLLAWRTLRKDRRVLKISAAPALNVEHSPEGKWIRVALQNRGFTPVHVRMAGIYTRLRRPDLGILGWRGVIRHKRWCRNWWYLGSSLPEETIVEPKLPGTIEPGRQMIVWLPGNAIHATAEANFAGDVRLFVQDEWDRTFTSAKLPTW